MADSLPMFSLNFRTAWVASVFICRISQFVLVKRLGWNIVPPEVPKDMYRLMWKTIRHSTAGALFSLSDGIKEYVIEVTQYSYLELIDFESPVVKDICVGLWDVNNDGEISYEEAVAVDDIDDRCFAGSDITSFDELKFFVNAFYERNQPEYLFEGSALQSVVLPQGLYWYTGKGTFKDCHELESVDLGNRYVDDEAFMNCTSLKKIEAVIFGKAAFMGCTALEEVVQMWNGIPDMTFKQCSSLRSFTLRDEFWSSEVSIGAEAFYGCSPSIAPTGHQSQNTLSR